MQQIWLLASAYDDSYFDCLSNQTSLMSHTAHRHDRQCEVDFDWLNFELMNNQFELQLISLHNLPELYVLTLWSHHDVIITSLWRHTLSTIDSSSWICLMSSSLLSWRISTSFNLFRSFPFSLFTRFTFRLRMAHFIVSFKPDRLPRVQRSLI